MARVGYMARGAAITWGDLESWQNMTGQRVTAWEAETLMKMSRWYVEAVGEFRGKTVLSPRAMHEYGKLGSRPGVGATLKTAIRAVAQDKPPKKKARMKLFGDTRK